MIDQMFKGILEYAKQLMSEDRPAHTAAELAEEFISEFDAPDCIHHIIHTLAEKIVNRDEYTLWLHYNINTNTRRVVNAMVADGCRKRGMNV